jgi:hypothetical protein
MERFTQALLLAAGAMSAAMATYHFFLPTQFRWDRAAEQAPPILRWALFALNTFFSTLLLLIDGLVLAVAWGRRHRRAPEWWMVAAGAIFWAVNLGYQLACPMPIPDSLVAVRIGLPAFSASVLLLHVLPLALTAWNLRRSPAVTV